MKPVCAWTPSKVTIRGFCEFGSNKNALTMKERDSVASDILAQLDDDADLEHRVLGEALSTFRCAKGTISFYADGRFQAVCLREDSHG